MTVFASQSGFGVRTAAIADAVCNKQPGKKIIGAGGIRLPAFDLLSQASRPGFNPRGAPPMRLTSHPVGGLNPSNPSVYDFYEIHQKRVILLVFKKIYGAGGIRTLGTLAGYNSLAGSPIRPLSHRSRS